MSKRLSYWLIFLMLGITTPIATIWAQKDSKKHLENKRIQLLKEIEETRKELDRVREKKKTSLNELVMLKSQINTRESLIGNYQLEIEALSVRIQDMTAIVASMQADYNRMREEYARLLRVSYKTLRIITDYYSFYQPRISTKLYKDSSTCNSTIGLEKDNYNYWKAPVQV